ncbi:hypothetical protein GCM10027174_17560 [Salinifilum aidingensis]
MSDEHDTSAADTGETGAPASGADAASATAGADESGATGTAGADGGADAPAARPGAEGTRDRSASGSAAEDGSAGASGEAAETGSAGGNERDQQTSAAPAEDLPASLAIRVSRDSLLAPLAIAVCATPVATLAGGPAPLLYLVPIALAVWIVRSETLVDAGGLTVRTPLRTRRIAWEQLRSLRLREHGWISAVLDSERQVRLSGVRTRDVPKLALMSGGRLPNPEQQE